ncbi:cytochrome P450 307a1 [Tribolium castaneum]|uniref:Cytochrome P450 307B1 n=1 Tax=Tribolium castaneum TaxID=7070 RepID=D2A689_TRICA|nr:PREDICTED: cytochrome P450 307a1 [Tribolium castaneum]XP_974280.1 PREDICTED: cytochrome P450 307a1 [Tribolium castaneum]EFA05673.1 cytochrome P450 307B1 [Tribolium castaneum]|eukprot:XP_015836416.1 PREDICTED: cytochrome P450 307a1 [Tribolium castaneum]
MFFTQFTLYLIAFVVLATVFAIAEAMRTRQGKYRPPSPLKLPIIGHLHLMSGYQVPYQAFTSLSKKFGSVFGLQLGYVKCVVINGQKNIREALVTKGHHFDSRPNFERYQQLFSGNKENSLAFCNWSTTQKTRRDMLKAYTFPRAFTNRFYTLEELVSSGTRSVVAALSTNTTSTKSVISRHCANIFTRHFCSKSFDVDEATFVEMVDNYDEIFYEVNQGYAADFLPFLLPFHEKNLKRVNGLTHKIRDFVLDHIIEGRFDSFDVQAEPDDYVESLIKYVKSGESPQLSWDSALFALEDIIGGHSAVANFLVKLFAFLAKEPQVQENIHKEIDRVLGTKEVSISHRTLLPYTEATIFEAIRLIASPIVPRVANRDSSINGLEIEKGTVIFLNNYDLSMSPQLWDEPEKFKPERFIREERLVKPEHFLPFGGGRRSCMGYKMVQLVSFGILGGIMQNFTIGADDTSYTVPVGSLALPKDTFTFKFVRR